MALVTYESQLCSGCGHPVWETMGEENDGEWQSEEFRCHACTANAALADQVTGEKEKPKYPEALRFAARRRDPDEVTFWQKPRAPSQSG